VEIAGDKRMTSSVFSKAHDAGDETTIELLDGAVEALGIACANAAAVLDLRLVVLGGGLADRFGPVFVGRVEQAIRSRLFAAAPLRVTATELGDEAGAVGAALLHE
jgi:glucokinase